MLLMDGHDLSNHYAIPIDCLSAPVLMIATLPNGELSLPPPLQPIVRMSTMAGKGGSLSGPSPPPPYYLPSHMLSFKRMNSREGSVGVGAIVAG